MLQIDLSNERLRQLFVQKHGEIANVGWSPTLRLNWDYFLPSDCYEAIVDQLVTESTYWLDVGGGRDIFPENPRLASQLSKRCKRLVGIDPSENILQNTFVHDRHQCLLEASQVSEKFDLITARMVVEHVEDPCAFVEAISRHLKPAGIVLIFTVDLVSVVSLVSRCTPLWFHHWIKKILWGTAAEDTFPVVYRMNRRHLLIKLFSGSGFKELKFMSLDDLSTLCWSSISLKAGLQCQRILKTLRVPFPDRCILTVYQKTKK